MGSKNILSRLVLVMLTIVLLSNVVSAIDMNLYPYSASHNVEYYGGVSGDDSGSFNGIDENIIATPETDFDFERTNAFSVNMWVKRDSTGALTQLYSKQVVSGDYTGYNLIFRADDTLRLSLQSTSTNRVQVETSANTDTDWQMITTTYDGSSSASGTKIYVNGVLASTTLSDSLTTSILNNEDFVIGTWNNGFYPFDGDMSNIEVLDDELTQQEITNRYNAGKDADISTADVNLVYYNYFDNKYLNFDGTDDLIQSQHNSNLNVGSSDFTLATWFKSSQSDPALVLRTLIGKGATGLGGKRYQIGYVTDSSGSRNGEIVFDIDDDVASAKDVRSTSKNYDDGLWHHVVATRDGNFIKLYIDGVFDGQTDITGYGSLDNTNELNIGADLSETYFFEGNLLNSMLMNYALSSTEVTDLYNEGLDANVDETANFYLSGNQLTDLSNNGNNANGHGGIISGSDNDFQCDGVDDYLSTDISLDSGDYSFSVWVNPTDRGSDNNIVMGTNDAGTSFANGFYFGDAGASDKWYYVTGDGSNQDVVITTTDVSYGVYSHVVFTRSGQNYKMYVNGNLISSTTATYTQNTVGDTLNICNQGDLTTVRDFAGSLSNVNYHNKELTQSEVTAEFNNGRTYENFPDVTNLPPSFLSYNISNTAPVRTNDVIDVNFKLDDLGDETNLTLTWFKSTDDITYTPHTTDDETFTNVSLNVTVNSGANGDLEASDTSAFDYWKAQLTATSIGGTTSVNTTAIFIENDAPQIASATSNTTNDNPVNVGDNVTFKVEGTDIEEDTITLKVCSNLNANWTTCNVIAQNLVGVSWSSVTNTSITADHVANETIRNNTALAIVYDGGNYSSINITYYVNQFPVLENITHQDTSGDTNYFFGESLDFVRVNMNDSYNGTSLTPYITIKDPENTVIVNNQPMSLTSGTLFEYSTNTLLNAVGTWNISINVTDSDGATSTLSSTFEVSSTNITTLGRIYAYDTENLSNYTEIDDLMSTYGYYTVEIHIDNDIIENNWTYFKSIVNEVKNNSQLIIITLDDDLSNESRSITNIETNFAELIGGDYLNAILMLKVDPQGTSNTSLNTAILNNITKSIFQETNNNFPVYVKNYQSTDINQNYALEDIYNYISTNNRSTYINEEMNLLRTTTDKSRFYNNLTTDFKGYARDWQTNIIDKLRSGINTSTTYPNNVAELTNNDLIVANNGSSTLLVSIDGKTALVGSDIYDITRKAIVELDTDTNFSLNVSPYSASLLYVTELSKVVVNDQGELNLFGASINNYPASVEYGGASENAFLFVSGSTNPDDGRIFLTDPSFNDMDFMVWYGTNGFEAIADWSRYNLIVVADQSNETWLEETAVATKLFGYIAVNTYGDENEPVGCTLGVNCTTWNRTLWLNDQKADINSWTDVNESIQIFIDGLDIGAVNDVDGLFDDSLVELADYVRITKQRELILNTYTSYQDYANLGDYTMRESACGRWDGTESSPTYSYENITLEKERALFHRTHNIPVLAQTFGNITDYEKAYYCFMQTKVLYGDLAEYSYNQPLFDYTGADDDFVWNYYKQPDLGVALEDSFTENGDLISRKFEGGIVTVNTTSHTVDFENNLQITNLSLCAFYYDNDDGANDEGNMHFVINDNLSKSFDVSDSDLSAFAKTWKCQDMGIENYEPSGWYELEFYYLDDDANYIGNSGLFMYRGLNSSQDQLSSWEQTLNSHPSQDETDYWQFARGDNWAMELSIDGTSELIIDDVSTSIDRNETGVEVKTINFTSNYNWDLPLYDKLVFINKTQWNGIYVNGTLLNTTYHSSCNTADPTYGITNISGVNWSSCYYNGTSGGYNVKVISPNLLQETVYMIDANTYPTIDSQEITLINLENGLQNITIVFNVSDADNNTINSCAVEIDNISTTGNYLNGVCTVGISTSLNSTTQLIVPYVYDEYNGEGQGTSYNSFTSVFNGLSWDENSTLSTNTIQYFWSNYNLTYDWEQNFTNISWSINSSYSPVLINLVNGTNEERFEANYSLVSESNYTLIEDIADVYYVDQGETIWKYFNVTNNLGIDVPEFNMSFVPEQYFTGTQTLTKYNGSSWENENFTSGELITFTNLALANGETNQYNVSHQAKVIYTTNELNFTTEGNTRSYFFNDGGLKYNFMFSQLLNPTNSIFHNIAYASLPNWNIRDTSANTFKDDQGNILVQNSDYTLTDTPASDLLILNFAPFIDDLYYLLNLTWSAQVVTFQCSDGIDNDGDGNIDFPDDAGCTSSTDDTENSENVQPPVSGGGGGGTTIIIGDDDDVDFNIKTIYASKGYTFDAFENETFDEAYNRPLEFEVTNDGDVDITIDISCDDTEEDNICDWITISDTELKVPSNGKATFTVDGEVPLFTQDGSFSFILLAEDSLGNTKSSTNVVRVVDETLLNKAFRKLNGSLFGIPRAILIFLLWVILSVLIMGLRNIDAFKKMNQSLKITLGITAYLLVFIVMVIV